MKRRKFVSTVPVVAAGVTCATPLLATSSSANKALSAQQALLTSFKEQVENSILDTNGVSGSQRHLYIPASRPRLVNGRLLYTNQAGSRVEVYQKNGQVWSKIS